MKGCRQTHTRHNALLPVYLLGLQLHQVASFRCSNARSPKYTSIKMRLSKKLTDHSGETRPCVLEVAQRPISAVAIWKINFVWSWLGLEIHMSIMTSPLGGDLWTSTSFFCSFFSPIVSFSFSSSSSLPLWQHMTRPAHTHFINQEGFVSTGAFLGSKVLPFFTVPREAASSHRSGAKSLNTCLCEALYDTRRHKRKYQMQGCLSTCRHSKE